MSGFFAGLFFKKMVENILNLKIIQPTIIWGDIVANLLHLEEMLEKDLLPADIIILPEMFTTGFSMDVLHLAETIDGKAFKWMQSIAKCYKAAITGSIIFQENSKYFNRLFWINPDGEWFTYDKRHLFSIANENQYFESGTERLIVNFKGWRICPLICYDLRFPVWSRNNNQYDLLVYVANWPAARNYVWNILLRARAIENQCFVAGVNRVGRDAENIHYIGESCVIHPKGYPITLLHEPNEMIIHSAINLEELLDFRKKFPVLDDADILSEIISK
jgi:predicted amidohydrolase